MDTSPEVPAPREGRGSLEGKLEMEPDWDSPETNRTVSGCPNDTDGDGNCGQVACPHCGKYRKAQDIADTPSPQRNTSTY